MFLLNCEHMKVEHCLRNIKIPFAPIYAASAHAAFYTDFISVYQTSEKSEFSVSLQNKSFEHTKLLPHKGENISHVDE